MGVHFLMLLPIFYLPIFALDNAFSAGKDAPIGIDVLNGFIVLMQCVFVVGLRVLGQRMVDPYGDDSEDLSVITYVETTLQHCRTIFTTQGSHLYWDDRNKKDNGGKEKGGII